jgi:hypothetical protein
VRAEPVDLEEQAAALEAGTAGTCPQLRSYAADHAQFLRSMSGGLRRQVYLVVKGKDAHALEARCQELVSLLVPLGLAVKALAAEQCVGLLARSTGQPVPDPGQAAPGGVVGSKGGHHGSAA